MIDKYPTVISFYTDDWKYPHYAERLKWNCEKMNISHHILRLESTGNYLTNTRMKPQYILDTIKKLKRPVLWIDVDGSLLKEPELLRLPLDCDFAFKQMPPHRDRTWHVATMFFNYNETVLETLEKWIETPGISDEDSLNKLWNANQINGKIMELPASYFEILKSERKLPKPDTVICHRISKGESKMSMKRKMS